MRGGTYIVGLKVEGTVLRPGLPPGGSPPPLQQLSLHPSLGVAVPWPGMPGGKAPGQATIIPWGAHLPNGMPGSADP